MIIIAIVFVCLCCYSRGYKNGYEVKPYLTIRQKTGEEIEKDYTNLPYDGGRINVNDFYIVYKGIQYQVVPISDIEFTNTHVELLK